MRDVQADSKAVHFLDGLTAIGCQAPVLRLQAAVAQDVALVVGELGDTQSQLVENGSTPSVPPYEPRGLGPKDDSQLPCFAGGLEVGDGLDMDRLF